MQKQQRGMTTLGLIILLSFIGLFAFGAIQMIPVYLENMKIQKMLTSAKTQLDGQGATVRDIRESLEKTANIEGLREVDVRQDFKISRSQDGYKVATEYSREKPFVANIFLVAKFDHLVEIKR